MSRLSPNQMTVRELEALKDGVHGDGGNLWITVKGKSRTWSFRYKSPITGRRREMGLGPTRDIGLAKARKLASEARELLREGVDPIDARERRGTDQQAPLTFEQVATRYIEEMKSGWRDPRAVPIWTSSLTRLAYPVLGPKPIDAISTPDVLAVLRPIWTTTTETADRLRGRMERILDYATAHRWREGENPARWRGHLSSILPKPSAVASVEHHAAVPWQSIATVMTALARSEGMGALAVRFACLTAARSMEVRAAPWSEIDLADRMWVIPAARMKMKREHRVPLSGPALEILEKVRPLASKPTDLVFPGGRPGRPLSDVALSKALHLAAGTKDVTVHGLRSTFRDWCAEATDYPHEVAEMALAHVVSNRVEAAYRRGDLFEKRRAVMDEWGSYASGSSTEATTGSLIVRSKST